MRSRLLAAAAVAYVLILTYLLLAPHPLWIFGGSGKVAERTVDRSLSGSVQHLIAYGILGALCPMLGGPLRRSPVLPLLAGAAVHAAACEALQALIPAREYDWTDLAANLIGVLSGAIIGYLASVSFKLPAAAGRDSL
ncbi:MAG: VanZ family protein [Planctomycetaceae bacterium]